MKRGWQAAAWIVLATCALFVYESYQLKLTDALGPGPGFFPFCLGLLGAVLAAVLLAQLRLDRVDLGAEALVFNRAGMRSIALVLAGLVVAAALLEVLGFRAVALLLIAYLLVVTGARSKLAIAICAVAGSFGVFYVFFDLLKVPLPVGILGF
jgi:putative tricarboxylic transport membrane protein